MYKYKLNNSYTVYVNWSYYSECAKICKDAHKQEKRAYSSITMRTPLRNDSRTVEVRHPDR